MGIRNDCWYTDRKPKCRGFRVAIIHPERYVKRSNIKAAGEMGVSLAAIQPAWIELNSLLRITVRAKEDRFNSCERLGLLDFKKQLRLATSPVLWRLADQNDWGPTELK